MHLLNHKKGTRLFFEEARINGFAVKLLSSNFLKTEYKVSFLQIQELGTVGHR